MRILRLDEIQLTVASNGARNTLYASEVWQWRAHPMMDLL
jgi:hypothetical protein